MFNGNEIGQNNKYLVLGKHRSEVVELTLLSKMKFISVDARSIPSIPQRRFVYLLNCKKRAIMNTNRAASL